MSVASSGVCSLGLAWRKGRAALAASSLNRGSARGERITASKNSRGDAAAEAASACRFNSVLRFGVPFFLPPDFEPSLFAIYFRLFHTTPITRLIRREAQCRAEPPSPPAQCCLGNACIKRSTQEHRELAWLSHNGAEYGGKVGCAVMPEADQGGWWKFTISGVDDNAAGGKGDSMRSRNSGGNVRLHIHGRCAGLRVQPVFLSRPGNRGIRSHNLRVYGPWKCSKKSACPCVISRKAFLLGPYG